MAWVTAPKPVRTTELMVAGRAAWQVLAGAAKAQLSSPMPTTAAMIALRSILPSAERSGRSISRLTVPARRMG